MNFHKSFSCILLSIYCFSSSILSHNAAMHHEDEHLWTQETISYQDECCDENNPQDTTSCFKKCFWEYTKIFGGKISLQQFKHIVAIKYYPWVIIAETFLQEEFFHTIQQNTAPPNIFLTSYIGTIKQTLYA